MFRVGFGKAWVLACTLLLAILVTTPRAVRAQGAGSGTITGSVTDPSGSVVPGASIMLRNTGTGIERKTQTNQAGIYEAPFLQPGQYEVRAEKTGFDTMLHKDVTLQVGRTLSVDF